MYKLQPNDIQGMLSEAARVLTQPADREIMRRLVSATRTENADHWDKRLIAAMLAKAGKMHEAELVANDIETTWQKADALWKMGKVVLATGDRQQALGLLHQAAIAADCGQSQADVQERLDAAAVLADIAITLIDAGQEKEAREISRRIQEPSRRQAVSNRLNDPQAESI